MKYAFLALLPLMLGSVATAANTAPLEKATFAAGCFWGTEELFRKIPGVMETKVGYAGGKSAASYEQVSSGGTGHAESVELTFDPAKVSYRDLLATFFKMHDPTTPNQQGNDRGSQYRSAVFTHSEAQRKVAEDMKARAAAAWKKPVSTEIAPAGAFYTAEEYHQKYLVKHPGGYDNHYIRNIEIK